MTKHEFERALREKLASRGLSESEITKSVDFYLEMIDDRIEDGMPEEEAVAAMDSIDNIVQQILYDAPLGALVKSKIKTSKQKHSGENSALMVLLLVLGFPIWFPLLITVFVLFISFYIVICALIFSVFAVVFALGVSGIAMIPAAIFAVADGPALTLGLLGAGCLLIGLTILLYYPAKATAVGLVKLTGAFLRGVKSLFIGKAAKN